MRVDFANLYLRLGWKMRFPNSTPKEYLQKDKRSGIIYIHQVGKKEKRVYFPTNRDRNSLDWHLFNLERAKKQFVMDEF